MAYKVFTNGSVLNASEVNENLMNQAVITFSNSTVRDSAITSPIEGQLTWLEDVNRYEFYNGSAWEVLISPSTGNAIINGAFEINQRGFTSSTVNSFGFDRWLFVPSGGTVTYSSQAFTLGSAPEAGYEAANFLRIVTSGQSAAADRSIVQQKIESVRTFAGQTVTLSFWAKAASGTPKIAAEIQQVFATGGSPSATVPKLLGQVTLSTSFQRFSITSTVDSISGKTFGTNKDDLLALNLWTSAGTDWNSRTGSLGVQNNTIDIWGVQLEAGSVATPFKRNANSLQGELAACQRYYFRQTGTTASRFAIGSSNTTTSAELASQFPVTMRVAPTAIDTTGNVADYSIRESNSTFVASSIPVIAGSNQNTGNLNYSVASGLTVGRGAVGRFNTDNGFIGWSAEL